MTKNACSVLSDLQYHIQRKILVNNETGCWEWIACRNAAGYGLLNKSVWGFALAHRYVFSALRGPIPEGHHLDHLCLVRHCVNPEHLDPKLPGDHVLSNPRSAASVNTLKLHCPKGHEYTESNTRTNRKGWRQCRQCDRESHAAKRVDEAIYSLVVSKTEKLEDIVRDKERLLGSL